MKILVISNGHGEDEIGASIVKALQGFDQVDQVSALPIVGEGYAYQKLHIPIIAPVKPMPSGGFNQTFQQFWRDLQGGLLTLTRTQYQLIRQWGKTEGKILSVGDFVPLLFAWLSGSDYGFVGTAKSDYYLRNERGWLPSTSALIRWRKSIYFPWERWLMSRPRCRGVFPRDSLTAKILQQWKMPVFDVGNPMKDGFDSPQITGDMLFSKDLTILLLPGSRMPEAQHNWQLILAATQAVLKVFDDCVIRFVAAIAPRLALTSFQEPLMATGWQCEAVSQTITINCELQDAQALTYAQNNSTLTLTQGAYHNCLQLSDVAIAMAGTATEQFVGLGKPVITFPGNGPQFTRKFALNQTRLLGCSIRLVETPQQVGNALMSLLNHPQKLQQIAENGKQRLGEPGAAMRIAECLVNQCFVN